MRCELKDKAFVCRRVECIRLLYLPDARSLKAAPKRSTTRCDSLYPRYPRRFRRSCGRPQTIATSPNVRKFSAVSMCFAGYDTRASRLRAVSSPKRTLPVSRSASSSSHMPKRPYRYHIISPPCPSPSILHRIMQVSHPIKPPLSTCVMNDARSFGGTTAKRATPPRNTRIARLQLCTGQFSPICTQCMIRPLHIQARILHEHRRRNAVFCSRNRACFRCEIFLWAKGCRAESDGETNACCFLATYRMERGVARASVGSRGRSGCERCFFAAWPQDELRKDGWDGFSGNASGLSYGWECRRGVLWSMHSRLYLNITSVLVFSLRWSSWKMFEKDKHLRHAVAVVPPCSPYGRGPRKHTP